ncbi:hypothetical protein [Okeania sp. SIO2C2]|uniref:hypothetical protein n=1 Tax=Okeania sp. SIO2C2 TaxID=2607787 RepID=UPI0025798785|nr:hypothetical protein [Okeania sp. SIO2C2]
MGEGRRQPTPRPSPSQEGNTGDRRQEKWECRGVRSNNCQNDFSAIVLPKIRSFLSIKS